MIQAKELRVGNWVRYNLFPNDFYTIRAVCEDRIHPIELMEHKNNEIYAVHVEEGLSMLEPIPLTSEILIQCGFNAAPAADSYSGWLVKISDTGEKVRIRKSTDGFAWPLFGHHEVPVNHLHQLQNLYFALTGKELEYKP